MDYITITRVTVFGPEPMPNPIDIYTKLKETGISRRSTFLKVNGKYPFAGKIALRPLLLVRIRDVSNSNEYHLG